MIIDFHTHVFPDRIAPATVNALAARSSVPPSTDGTATGLRRAMEEAGVSLAVNLPVLTKATQFESVTSFAEAINQGEKEGPRILSFGGVHPDMEDACERLDELAARGFLGIKIHPDYQGRFIDDEAYLRILERAKALGLITVTHAGLDAAYVGQKIKCTPRRILRVLDRLGGYDRLVLAHLGASEMWDDVLSLLAGEELYLDTAYSLHAVPPAQFVRILEKHGDERILFATDSPWRPMAEDVGILRGLGLGRESEERILAGNAQKLLGMVTI